MDAADLVDSVRKNRQASWAAAYYLHLLGATIGVHVACEEEEEIVGPLAETVVGKAEWR